nr:GAF domain-containing protein [Oceanococcus sp. HetDA_MAG_MS8]
MLEAAKPRNEDERLAVLHALDLLDKPKEQRFERITSIASTTFGVPIALVTLLDTDQQHFKACVGLDIPGTARSVSFCSHAILQPDIMLVEDATLDPRFADNPLVTGAPHIRFYAGAPIEVSPDIRLGTLCLIDTQPRSLNQAQQDMLRSLAAVARDELLRAPAPETAEAHESLRRWLALQARAQTSPSA